MRTNRTRRTAPRHRGALVAVATSAVIGFAWLWSPATVEAQGRAQAAQGIPPGHLPTPGECRVWYDGRPPGQQPSPTGCVAARREAARTGGRVIYGDDRRGRFERVDRAGRNPYPDARYPSVLPDMVWGVMVGRGRQVDGVREWLGTGDVSVDYTDRNRNGVPNVVTWKDARGTIIQRWIDDNGNGRADRVLIYERGRVARVIR